MDIDDRKIISDKLISIELFIDAIDAMKYDRLENDEMLLFRDARLALAFLKGYTFLGDAE